MASERRVTDDQAKAIAARILLGSGIARAEPADLEFAVSAFRAKLTAREVIRRPEFSAMLSSEARCNLKGAWYSTIGPVFHALVAIRDFNRGVDAGIEHFQFLPSNMAAGPCAAAIALEGVAAWDGFSAPPLAGCDHPDQCGCLWQSVIIWDDD